MESIRKLIHESLLKNCPLIGVTFTSDMDPIQRFEKLFKSVTQNSNDLVPPACCLSTLGLDGYPNSRYVSLKKVIHNEFIFTGSLQSRKMKELKESPKACVAFWWDVIGIQVRIQGNVRFLTKNESAPYFNDRHIGAQILSFFDQGQPIDSYNSFKTKFNDIKKAYLKNEITQTNNWGGVALNPVRIEFLKFDTNRLHKRELYFKEGPKWKKIFLNP